MRSPRTTAKSSPCSLQLEKARVQQQRPNTAKKEDVSCGNAWNSIYLFIYLGCVLLPSTLLIFLIFQLWPVQSSKFLC